MAPPPQQTCTAEGCDFITPENIPTWDLVLKQLEIHQKSRHPEPVQQQQQRGGGGHHAKVDKKVRPTISPQMTEEGWRFLLDEWSRYKRQTGIQDQVLLDELWSCMSEDLRQLAFAEGGSAQLLTEGDMLARIKKLAVVTLHPSVHVVALHELRQQSDENVQTFAARVRGIAASCGLTKECECSKVVSFSEETCYHVVLSGMSDQSMKERALTQSMMSTIKDLDSLVTWCTADEGGRLGTPGLVGRLRQQSGLKQSRAKKCKNCGAGPHGDGGRAAREKDCKAFGKTCSKCKKSDHFASVCKSSMPQTNAITERKEEDEPSATNNALSFFAIQNVIPSSHFWRPWQPTTSAPVPPTTSTSPSLPGPNVPYIPDTPQVTQSISLTMYSVSTENRFTPLDDQIDDDHHIPTLPAAVSAPPSPGEQSACRPTKIFRRSKTLPHVQPSQDLLQPVLQYQPPELVPNTPLQLATLVEDLRVAHLGPVKTVKLPHILHTVHDGWIKSGPRNNPSLNLTIKLHLASYKELGLDIPCYNRKQNNRNNSTTSSIMDTGAQMALAPISILTQLGLQPESLLPLESRVAGASREPIHLVGGVLVEVTGISPTGETASCLQLLYISTAVTEVYMSLDVCIQLGVVPGTFPTIQSCNSAGAVAALSQAEPIPNIAGLPACTNSGVLNPDEPPCTCPDRSLPPSDKPVLPCPPTAENLPILKNYILQRYASSAFNTCERRPLPLMDGSPPMRLFVDPDAPPIALNRPAIVPLHWKDAVKGGLDRDVRLGVLEKIDVNDPVEWCSRMVVTPKPNSHEPRRCVDFGPLNLHAPRQTHHTQSPWSLVSSIPPNMVKSCLDCWHGYHSIEIDEADRYLTTFVTEWGRYRYRTMPQGFISAGDGYTQRSDKITAEVPRLKKCIDDSLLYDTDIETNFFRVCDYLELCSKHGMIFNPKKFQLASETVKYLGFQVTQDGIQPTTEFLDTIRSFPSPRNITDIRSWFGCIAQISYTFSTSPVMEPFRHLLSSKEPYQWTPELEDAFQASKEEIVQQCWKGVKSFDPALPTALATDWCKMGMGFWLTQKKCDCSGATMPGCCADGWVTVYCGSRFCKPAESRYPPIEGEGAAITWAMEKCKTYLLGMRNFILAIDHNPLVSIFGKQGVMDIPNPRLTSQKIKTMMFSFTPLHIPGKMNVVADCFSRRSDSPIPPSTPKPQELLDVSNIMPGYADHLGPPSWVSCTGSKGSPPLSSLQTGSQATLYAQPQDHDDHYSDQTDALLLGFGMAALAELYDEDDCLRIAAAKLTDSPTLITWSRLEDAASKCLSYQALHSLVSEGAPEDRTLWPETLLPYYQHRQFLFAVDSIVLLHDRPVIPAGLRAGILDHLHAGHSAVTSMYARATSCVYWPNMRDDIVKMRAGCAFCNTIAPSNPSPPPHPIINPAFPFSDICADFFEYSSKTYLAIVDRYSNWLSIFHLTNDTSANIIKIIRNYCICWGVPQSLSTDGASNFTSREIEMWLRRWGIHHRVSSYYYPRSNKRAEVAVKSAKRMIMNNLGPNGSLDSDRMARALLLHRNCPDPITGLSPAQVIFGRVLRDHIPLQPGKFSVRAEWRQTAEMRERALAQRHMAKKEELTRGTKLLPPLHEGDTVMVQDQSTHKPGRWTKTGKIVEVLEFDSYLVKIDGSNHVTKRNRKFLRKFSTYIDKVAGPDTPSLHSAPPPYPTPYPAPSTARATPPPPPSSPSHAAPGLPSSAEPTKPIESPASPIPTPDHIVTSVPPVKSPPKIVLNKKKTGVKEMWIVSPPKQTTQRTLLPPYSSSPPPPGTQHDYNALDKEASRLRDEVRSSLVE